MIENFPQIDIMKISFRCKKERSRGRDSAKAVHGLQQFFAEDIRKGMERDMTEKELQRLKEIDEECTKLLREYGQEYLSMKEKTG